jgi:uncharacterized membrane protein YjjP (DUF1212 family)
VVSGVARLADTASVDPDDGMRALDDAEALPHRFGPVGIVAGHATIALGACLILQPTPMVLLTSTLLGALVGLLKLRAATAPTLRVVLPIVAAVPLSLLVFCRRSENEDAGIAARADSAADHVPAGRADHERHA